MCKTMLNGPINSTNEWARKHMCPGRQPATPRHAASGQMPHYIVLCKGHYVSFTNLWLVTDFEETSFYAPKCFVSFRCFCGRYFFNGGAIPSACVHVTSYSFTQCYIVTKLFLFLVVNHQIYYLCLCSFIVFICLRFVSLFWS